MPTNKNALIRYQALDKCFSNPYKNFYIEDLIEACSQAIYDYTGIEEGVKRRQIYADITFMESEQGWNIPLERIKDGRRVYFRYDDENFSINKQPLSNNDVEQLKGTILMLSRFKGIPNMEWMEEFISNIEDKFHLKGSAKSVICLDQNQYLTGIEYISPLFNAIINHQVLHIEYHSFKRGVINWVIHPYYLKQYNNRWFLLGLNDEFKNITNVPLDRINAIEPVRTHYIENKEIDFDEYFCDVIGVTIPPEQKIEKILLKFAPQRFPYVLSKPLHESMRVKDRAKGIVEIDVIPNKEFYSLIMSYGNEIEVLEPSNVKEVVRKEVQEQYKKYFSV